MEASYFFLNIIIASLAMSSALVRLIGVRPSDSLFFSQCLVILILFLAGIFKLLEFSAIALNALSCLYFLYILVNDRKLLLNQIYIYYPIYLLLFMLYIYMYVNGTNYIGHGDEFNYWASQTKDFILNNRLPLGDDSIYWKMYHPGITLYNYFNLYTIKVLEPFIYLSFTFINLSGLRAIFPKKGIGLIIFLGASLFFYKVIGLGFKSLVVDTFIMISIAVIINFINNSLNYKNIYLLTLPIAALTLSKQPGYLIVMLLSPLILYELLRFKTFKKALVITALLVAYSLCINKVWEFYVFRYHLQGLFITSINNGSVFLLLKNIFVQGPDNNQINIFYELIDIIYSLKIGLPFDFDHAAKKMPFFGYLIFIFSVYYLSFYRGLNSKIKFYWYTFSLFISISIWLFALYALAVLHFSKTSEGNFASIDRYMLILVGGYIIFSISLLINYVQEVNSSKLVLVFVVLCLTIFSYMKSDNLIFSNREIKSGAREYEAVNQCVQKNLSIIKSSKIICLVSNEDDYLYKVRVKYEILPNGVARELPVNYDKSAINEYGCNLVIEISNSISKCDLNTKDDILFLEIPK